MAPCKEADEALKYAIAAVFTSLFCIGAVIGPIAIVKGTKARQMIAANPYLVGSGKATAAIIIGTLSFLFSIFAIIKGQMRQ